MPVSVVPLPQKFNSEEDNPMSNSVPSNRGLLENPLKSVHKDPTYTEIKSAEETGNKTKETQCDKRKALVEFWINEPVPQLILATLLIMSLFMPDAWVLGNAPDSSNVILYSILMVAFVVFSFETIILSIVQKGYFLSFFFYMDLIGTLSILLDIGWISDTFIPAGTVTAQGSVLRATKAAKLGARYGRLMRLMKFLRFMQDIPCLQFLKSEDDYEPSMKTIKKVTEELSAILSLRVAALVMLLVIIMPFLAHSVTDFSPNAWLDNIRLQARNSTVNEYDIQELAYKCKKFYVQKDSDLRYIHIESPYVNPLVFEETYSTHTPLRDGNVVEYVSSFHVTRDTLESSDNPNAIAAANSTDATIVYFTVDLMLDVTYQHQMDAMYSIIVIVMVIVILFVFTGSFNSAVKSLVVQPLEKMLKTLRQSAMVMLNTMSALEKHNKQDDDEDKEEEEEEDDGEMESAMLEKMVGKLAKMLKHVLPGNAEIVCDENIDKSTAAWLNEAYSAGGNQIRDVKKNKDLTGKDEQQRLAELKSQQNVVNTDVLNSWDFDVLDYSDSDLIEVMTYTFTILNVLPEFNVPPAVFQNFLAEISSRYIASNTYHNFKHGCDVCHTTYRLMMITQLNSILSPLEVFSLMIGAVAHDVGHPGINNEYLKKSKHELAMAHNDRSPLENMHCVVLYEILRKDSTNIMVNMTDVQWRDARKVIVTVILGTDMLHHFDQINKTKLFGDMHADDTRAFYYKGAQEMDCMREEKNRMFIMELILHCSDISNPYKPYKISARWADLVVEEFCRQGDREKSEGLEISPMCDRDNINLCNMQMGFIEFVVSPLIGALITIFPPLVEIGEHMTNNVYQWGQKRKQELVDNVDNKMSGDEIDAECKKMDTRLDNFKEKMSFLDELKALTPTLKNI